MYKAAVVNYLRTACTFPFSRNLEMYRRSTAVQPGTLWVCGHACVLVDNDIVPHPKAIVNSVNQFPKLFRTRLPTFFRKEGGKLC